MNVLNLFGWLRSLRLILVLPFLCHDVAANTEIISFSSSRVRTTDPRLDVLVGNWSTLHPSDNERQWTLEPAALHTPLHQVCEHVGDDSEPLVPSSCPHELWVLLDLDDETWASHSTFTLRLSWPASVPVDVAIALYTPQDLLALARPHGAPDHADHADPPRTTTTRARYARIRAVNAGVPTPGLPGLSPPSSRAAWEGAGAAAGSSSSDEGRRRVRGRGRVGDGGAVPLVLVLEPAYLGVLPATLLPTVGVLALVLLAAVGVVAPWVMAYIEPFAREAREDLNAGMTCSPRKER